MQSANRKKIIIYTLAILCGLYVPLSLFVNPGWLTFAVFYNPSESVWMPVVFPLLVFLAAHAFRPKDWRIPTELFRLELIFCALWLVLWSLNVNGGDTEGSLHSIFSRIFSGIWPERILVDLSPALFVFMRAVLTFVGALIIFYRRDRSTVWRKWAWGLVLLNGVFIILPSIIQSALFQAGLWTADINSYMNVLMSVTVLIDVLNIAFVIRYLKAHKNVALRARILGWFVAVLSAISLLNAALWAAALSGIVDFEWLIATGLLDS